MKTPLEHDLFQACLLELTEGHLALDRLGAPREIQQGNDIRECLIAERISSVIQDQACRAADAIIALTAQCAPNQTLRELVEFWIYDGRLQTFEDRERFRKAARAALTSADRS